MTNHAVYGGPTILSHPLVVEVLLPFLLVFTLVFAVLQKSEILGKGKRQIDAIVGLVVGLMVVSFGNAVGIIVNLIPFLSVSLVIILVFMLLIGIFNKEGDFGSAFPKGLRIALMIVVIIAVVMAVLFITNAWTYLFGLFAAGSGSGLLVNIIFIAVIIGAVLWVVFGTGKASSGGTK